MVQELLVDDNHIYEARMNTPQNYVLQTFDVPEVVDERDLLLVRNHELKSPMGNNIHPIRRNQKDVYYKYKGKLIPVF